MADRDRAIRPRWWGRGSVQWAWMVLLIVWGLAPLPVRAQSVLGSYESLSSDQSRSSGNGRHTLYFQSDGNLVLARDGGVIWATGTWAPNGRVDMQGDGNLVIYDEAWNVVWATGTDGSWGAYLSVLDDGGVMVFGGGGEVLWSTGTSEPPADNPPAGDIIYPDTSIYWSTSPQQHHPGLDECLGNCGAGCSDTNNPCGGPDQHWTFDIVSDPVYQGTFGPELQCWGDKLVSWEWQQYSAIGRWTYHGWASEACHVHDILCGGWNLWTGCLVWTGCGGDFWEDQWSYDEYVAGFITTGGLNYGPDPACGAIGA